MTVRVPDQHSQDLDQFTAEKDLIHSLLVSANNIWTKHIGSFTLPSLVFFSFCPYHPPQLASDLKASESEIRSHSCNTMKRAAKLNAD